MRFEESYWSVTYCYVYGIILLSRNTMIRSSLCIPLCLRHYGTLYCLKPDIILTGKKFVGSYTGDKKGDLTLYIYIYIYVKSPFLCCWSWVVPLNLGFVHCH